MSTRLRPALRRKLLALLAAPLLAGAVSAAAPLRAADVRAEVSDVAYQQTFYSDGSRTQVVGVGYGYCDGSFSMDWGYQTSYWTRRFYPCLAQ
jgi:hypothetical protein